MADKSKPATIDLKLISIILACCVLAALPCACCGILLPDSPDDSENSSEPQVQGEQSSTKDVATVTEVTDGDTIKIQIDGEEETVRLIGIDAPESNHPDKPVECFAKESTEYLNELVDDKEIYYEFDKSQDEKDKYGRLLLYIWTADDDEFINEKMVRDGYAHEYTYDDPYKYQDEFKVAQNEAREGELGLWGDVCACEKGAEVSRNCVSCKKASVSYSNWDCSKYDKEVEDVSCTTGCHTPPPVQSPSPVKSCCKICTKGKACGDSCINKNYTCHQLPGCACDG